MPALLPLTASRRRLCNVRMIETYLFMSAAGSLMMWFLLDRRAIGPRFFRLHTLIVATLTLAGTALWIADWPPQYCRSCWVVGVVLAAFPLAGVLATLGVRLAAVRNRPTAAGMLCVLGAVMLLASAAYAKLTTGGGLGGQLSAATVSIMLGAILLGATLQGMLVGHAYLTASALPTRVLVSACRWLIGIAAVRTFWVAGMFGAWYLGRIAGAAPPSAVASMTWLFVLMRVLFGLVTPLALGGMALSAAKIRSTQSATGILFPALVLVTAGELCALYLLGATGLAL
ncbi:MAG: hypothetical protein BIFFINMI_00165 [Phycisphaerae bacterium]|nr:hypothetical protein [Phycisphaerae bacterium]